VNDRVELAVAEESVEHRGVSAVPFDERRPAHGRAMPEREVVEDDHVARRLDEVPDDVTPDVPGASGD